MGDGDDVGGAGKSEESGAAWSLVQRLMKRVRSWLRPGSARSLKGLGKGLHLLELTQSSRASELIGKPLASAIEGADLSVFDTENGRTALMWAIIGEREELAVELAYAMTAEQINLLDHSSWGALDFAVQAESCKLVELLVGRGANLESVDQEGVTPLSMAANRGLVDMVKLLLSLGANPKVVDEDGHSPLWVATSAGFSEAALALLPVSDTSVLPEGCTLLHLACYSGALDLAKALLVEGSAAMLDKSGLRPLDAALESLHPLRAEFVDLLLPQMDPWSVDAGGRTLLEVLSCARSWDADLDETLARKLLGAMGQGRLGDVEWFFFLGKVLGMSMNEGSKGARNVLEPIARSLAEKYALAADCPKEELEVPGVLGDVAKTQDNSRRL